MVEPPKMLTLSIILYNYIIAWNISNLLNRCDKSVNHVHLKLKNPQNFWRVNQQLDF